MGDLVTETETAVAEGAGRLVRAEVKLGGFIRLSGLPRAVAGLGLRDSRADLWYSAS